MAKRVDQHIDCLYRPQLADTHDIGGIGPRYRRFELGLGNAVAHDTHDAARRSDQSAVKFGDVAAFEQKQIGARIEDPLDRPVKAAAERAGTIDQRAAMRRVGADGVRRGGREAGESRALGAVAMKDVRRQTADPARNAPQRIDVAQVELARDRNALHAERKARRKFGEDGVGALAPGHGIDNQADPMAALDLAVRHIHHVPEQSAKRRPQNMHDLETGRERTRVQVGARKRRRGPSPGGRMSGVIERGSPMRGP